MLVYSLPVQGAERAISIATAELPGLRADTWTVYAAW
eukprot:COSAG06_NODE_10869_length_1604_cov_2.923664_1_plen_36_part_10